ncbi:unnamed protein product [Mytilus coruscus]|uniref:Potassium channel tetramerisation-type BTB domain-containing protein n=1 Tax=Mytilus coruscus TaxID=42192 RepID=A0A6J8CR60_MYTCO|nr:unnamed protein product [Mytilus coruscus]
MEFLNHKNDKLEKTIGALYIEISGLDVSELANKKKINDLTTSCSKLETENNALRYDSCDCKIKNQSRLRQNQNKEQNVNHDLSRGRRRHHYNKAVIWHYITRVSAMDKCTILNVGGMKFITENTTLKKYPETRLGLLSNQSKEYISEKGFYFFDRNPELFNIILDFYRNNEVHIPSGTCGSLVEKELEF